MPATQEVRTRAAEILDAMEADVSLVPEHLTDWWSNYLRYHRDRYLSMLDFMDGARGTLLEIGSVPCQFTLLLKKLGYDVSGVDLAPERMSAFLEKHALSVERVDVETDPFPFPDGSQDMVLFFEVMEHLRINPLHTFREMARVLKPGGKLLLSTPNITPAHRLMFLMGKEYQGNVVEEFRKLETIGHMGHFRLYSLGDIKGIVVEAGLELVSCDYDGECVDTMSWKTRLFRLIHPKKKLFRAYTNVIARKV